MVSSVSVTRRAADRLSTTFGRSQPLETVCTRSDSGLQGSRRPQRHCDSPTTSGPCLRKPHAIGIWKLSTDPQFQPERSPDPRHRRLRHAKCLLERLGDHLPDVARAAPVRAGAGAGFEQRFRRLAGEFPEFAFWVNLVDHQATRAEIRGLRTALTGLANDLLAITTGSAPDPIRAELARAHQAAPLYVLTALLVALRLPGSAAATLGLVSYSVSTYWTP